MEKAPIRRQIDSLRPLIEFRIANNEQCFTDLSSETPFARSRAEAFRAVKIAYELQPEKIKPYLALHVGVFPFTVTDSDFEWLDGLLSACDEYGIYAGMSVAGWNSICSPETMTNYMPFDMVRDMFSRHKSLIGVYIVE